MAERRTGAQWLRTTLGDNHIAGHGCIEDDYSEKSGCRDWESIKRKGKPTRFTNDHLSPETLNGPVIIVKKGEKPDDGKSHD